ncbi:hypothetical protein O1L60_35975 [Streptomyces diastatochromogenes]|nr:hypothetical protein [Streptomyces diastatochromogenes]
MPRRVPAAYAGRNSTSPAPTAPHPARDADSVRRPPGRSWRPPSWPAPRSPRRGRATGPLGLGPHDPGHGGDPALQRALAELVGRPAGRPARSRS